MARQDEIVRRIQAADAERVAAEKELEKLNALPDFEAMADGTVFPTVVRLGGRAPYTYVGFKTKGRFYFTGATGPNGVGVDEVQRWLTRAGRTLVAFQELAVVQVDTSLVGDVFDIAAALADGMRQANAGLAAMFDESSGRGL
jgi:hypothetical protein